MSEELLREIFEMIRSTFTFGIPIRIVWTWGYSTGWVHHSHHNNYLKNVIVRWIQQYRYTAILSILYFIIIIAFIVWGTTLEPDSIQLKPTTWLT